MKVPSWWLIGLTVASLLLPWSCCYCSFCPLLSAIFLTVLTQLYYSSTHYSTNSLFSVVSCRLPKWCTQNFSKTFNFRPEHSANISIPIISSYVLIVPPWPQIILLSKTTVEFATVYPVYPSENTDLKHCKLNLHYPSNSWRTLQG